MGSHAQALSTERVAKMKTKDKVAQKYTASSVFMGRFTCQSSVLMVFLSQRCLLGRDVFQEHWCLNSEFEHLCIKIKNFLPGRVIF